MSKNPRRFLVVDAWVIATASKHSLENAVWKAVDVLCKILCVCHKIVLDYEDPVADTILNEYQRQAKSEITKRWIIAMQSRQDKIVYRPRASINISVLTDPDDLKYFQVAINSPHKVIISEDSDLMSIASHPEITSKGLAVWNLDDAQSNL